MSGFIGHWSKDELNRTMDEVKRRSLADPAFRMLAISNPVTAIARINPKPLPPGMAIKFSEDADAKHSFSSGPNPHLIIVLPAPVENIDELSDAELEQAAGGMTDISSFLDRITPPAAL